MVYDVPNVCWVINDRRTLQLGKLCLEKRCVAGHFNEQNVSALICVWSSALRSLEVVLYGNRFISDVRTHETTLIRFESHSTSSINHHRSIGYLLQLSNRLLNSWNVHFLIREHFCCISGWGASCGQRLAFRRCPLHSKCISPYNRLYSMCFIIIGRQWRRRRRCGVMGVSE